jgi:hypothetical protein
VTTSSKLHPKFQSGVVVIAGLWARRSTLAFTAARPDQTAVLDFDLKGEQMARDYGIRHYAAPNVVSDNPADYDVKSLAEWFVQQVQAIPDGTTSLVLDNATWVEAGLGYLVARNPAKYGVREANVQSGRYGGVNPGITKLWANIVNYLQTVKGVKTVFAINHMSEPWINGVPALIKYVVQGNKVFRQLCICAFILVPPDIQRGGQPPVPSALVAREALAIRRWDGEQYVTQRALPMRIPVADWTHINRYFDEPADFAHPAAGETWSEHELHAYGDWLSEEQVQWALSVQSYEEEVEEAASPQPTIAEVKQAWIEEATRVELVQGPQDVPGLQELKRLLGETYTNLAPGCNAEDLRLEGLNTIRGKGNGKQAA